MRVPQMLSLALAVAAAAGVWLVQTVVEQRAQIAALTTRPQLEIGATVPALDLTDEDMGTITIGFDDHNRPFTFLYFISPSCVWCDLNRDAVVRLSDHVKDQARFVGIALKVDPEVETLSEYASRASLGFPLYTHLSESAGRAYRIRGTPTSVVVNAEGQVVRVWEQAFGPGVKEEVEEFFDVALPELPPIESIETRSSNGGS